MTGPFYCQRPQPDGSSGCGDSWPTKDRVPGEDCPCPATGHASDCAVALRSPCDYCGAERGEPCAPNCAYWFEPLDPESLP